VTDSYIPHAVPSYCIPSRPILPQFYLTVISQNSCDGADGMTLDLMRSAGRLKIETDE
jgi:hypothetical protein